MTINDFIKAIAEALFNEFGASYDIYTEQVQQNLKTPCFLIRTLEFENNVDLGSRYRRINPFVIQYIPESQKAHNECLLVMGRLFDCLKDVVVSGKIIHGFDLHGSITDGILTFTVNYNDFILDIPSEVGMGSLEVKTEAKG